MEIALNKLPPGVSLGAISQKVFAVIQKHTAFPWPIIMAQCRRRSVDPSAIRLTDLEQLIPLLASGVGRFTSPEKEEAVRSELSQIRP